MHLDVGGFLLLREGRPDLASFFHGLCHAHTLVLLAEFQHRLRGEARVRRFGLFGLRGLTILTQEHFRGVT